MANKVNTQDIEHLIGHLLVAIGEDPKRPGLKDTPARVARYWKEFIDYKPGNTNTVFESITVDQMVVVSGMRVYSLCEHHLLPFWCDISIGYITGKKVLGLSKFARIAHKHAHKLQIQERLVTEIRDDIAELTGVDDVAVIAKGIHLCMVMRGIQTTADMTSSAMTGAFRNNPEVRGEFLNISGLH